VDRLPAACCRAVALFNKGIASDRNITRECSVEVGKPTDAWCQCRQVGATSTTIPDATCNVCALWCTFIEDPSCHNACFVISIILYCPLVNEVLLTGDGTRQMPGCHRVRQERRANNSTQTR
jgi:hypothetical protein